MKPYIAILIDSFWEAVGNRVLWAMLLGWSLLLLGLAPFGYISENSFQLSNVDIDNTQQLVSKLAEGAKGRGSHAVQAVTRHVDAGFREQLKKRPTEADDSDSGQRISRRELTTHLRVAMKSPELYSEADFPTAQRRERLKELIEIGPEQLAEPELLELNRELLQLAFPVELNTPRGEQLWIGYAGMKLGDALEFSRSQIRKFLEPLLLAGIIKLGLGVLAVFIAIIVTSPIVPDTFRSGSLHLLLSKPISRVWLYLFKFFGGCVFALVNITFVLVGLYLIAGMRFEIWNHGLLACIPLLMFVFVIFYSVSAFAGLIWGNPIVSVVVCMVFWVCCFSLGFLHDALLPRFEILPQVRRVMEVEDRLLAVNEGGQLLVWNAEFQLWQPGVDSNSGMHSKTFGPFYDSVNDQLVVKSFQRSPFGELRAATRKLALVPLKQEPVEEAARTAAEARDQQLWMSEAGPALPQKMFDLLEMQDSLIAVCRNGLYRIGFEQLKPDDRASKGLFGFKNPWASSTDFQSVTPPDFFTSENTSGAVLADQSGVVLYTSGDISLLVWEEGQLRLEATTQLNTEADGTEACLVQMNADFCVAARDGWPLVVLDRGLQPVGEVTLPEGGEVRQLDWLPNTNELAVITHSGEFWKLNCEDLSLAHLQTPYRGQITSMNWLSPTRVWLGVKPNRVYLLDLATVIVEREIEPLATLWDRIFRWGIQPIYHLNPKPAALDNAMGYVLTGEETQSLSLVTTDLRSAQLKLDVWTPIISNLCFVALMLSLACIYVSRKEY